MRCEISVITCAHNPRPDYLKQVLEALKVQTLDQQCWEYVLIDNASDEPLNDAVDLSWHPRARHVKEEKLGLTHARLRGIRESLGELLVFVDDDNVLDADFLDQALNIAKEWPRLGAWSGQSRPVFEVPPPEWTRPYWSCLVIREFDSDRWSNQPSAENTVPWGAGLCVRKSVADYYSRLHATGERRIVMDRVGKSLVSGGDTDIAMCACDVGLGMGLFTSLKLIHLISAFRLTEDYLVRLVEGIQYSGVLVNSFRSTNGNPPARKWSTLLADCVRLLIRNRRDRRFFRAMKRGQAKAVRLLNHGG